jgi:alkylation response protein AidB-like acyl-CoA dehydrogenase
MPAHPDDVDVDTFRLRARAWLAEHGRHELHAESTAEYWEEGRRFQAEQYAAGFSGIAWPERYGGQGLTQVHQQAFNDEANQYELPSSAFQITHAILGMALLDHGSEAQKERHIRGMLRGDELWVQLLSEPGAGSDLAASRMRADLDGEEWVLNGEKVWSSFAQWSDYAMVLARTDWDVPKHVGLTMFLMPLKDVPGMTLRPLRQLGGDEEFCQEFLDEVRLPHDAVIGKVNGGWSVATSLFNHSRTMTSGAGLTGPVFQKSRGGDADPARDLIELVNAAGLGADAAVRELVAEAVTDNIVSGLLANRAAKTLGANPVVATMAKMFGAKIQQRRAEIDLEIRGEAMIGWSADDPVGGEPAFKYFKARTSTVAGGTTEVSKNMIGERLLGLPREPDVEKGKSFREVLRAARGEK